MCWKGKERFQINTHSKTLIETDKERLAERIANQFQMIILFFNTSIPNFLN